MQFNCSSTFLNPIFFIHNALSYYHWTHAYNGKYFSLKWVFFCRRISSSSPPVYVYSKTKYRWDIRVLSFYITNKVLQIVKLHRIWKLNLVFFCMCLLKRFHSIHVCFGHSKFNRKGSPQMVPVGVSNWHWTWTLWHRNQAPLVWFSNPLTLFLEWLLCFYYLNKISCEIQALLNNIPG